MKKQKSPLNRAGILILFVVVKSVVDELIYSVEEPVVRSSVSHPAFEVGVGFLDADVLVGLGHIYIGADLARSLAIVGCELVLLRAVLDDHGDIPQVIDAVCGHPEAL